MNKWEARCTTCRDYAPTVENISRDLRSYYEAEATLRKRKPLSSMRVALIDEYILLLRDEGRRSVIDFGAGPGLDGARFVNAGHRYVGVDLAHGNAVLAGENNVTVVQAHLGALPFQPRRFDAGWSMSTLMHIREVDTADALHEMIAVLRPGAPMHVGLWGGPDGDVISEQGIDGQRRLFSLRSFRRNQELLGAFATIEWSTSWDFGPEEWPYHLFRLRIGD